VERLARYFTIGSICFAVAILSCFGCPSDAQTGGGSGIIIQEEGTSVANTRALNFTGTAVTCSPGSGRVDCAITGGSGGAPIDATYITQTSDATLTNEQALSLLSNGILKHAAGVVSMAVSGTDYEPANTYSGIGACGVNTWASTLNDTAAPTCTQPAFSNISGTATDAQLASNYSGVGACAANTWASTLNDNASPTCTQPAFSNISGTATDAQLASNYSGVGACAANTWASTLNDNASPTCTQPAFSNISGTVALSQITDSGTASQCLLSGGSGGDPGWNTCPGGSLNLELAQIGNFNTTSNSVWSTIATLRNGTLAANTTYSVIADLLVHSNASTTGIHTRLSTGTTMTSIQCHCLYPSSATAVSLYTDGTAGTLESDCLPTAGPGNGGGNAWYLYKIQCEFLTGTTPGSASILIQFKSEVSGSQVDIRRGSSARVTW
jgi:hypothetical protein